MIRTDSKIKYDEDTFRLLEISTEFLIRFFEHTQEKADILMMKFLKSYSKYYDEDILHHESSYRIAAIVHYLIELKGSRETLGNWLVENGYNKQPPEALEYFRDHYFVR